MKIARHLATLATTSLICLAALTTLTPQDAHAFCGFYVSGGDAELFNDATQVVLMREGTKTVLSMQNNYKGPLKDFAMVVPVPIVLQQDNVKTLPSDLFKKIDTLTAPRLVEYWEQDPCAQSGRDVDLFGSEDSAANLGAPASAQNNANQDPTVTVEAQFAVGEYDIVILSATEANGLESWLKTNNYNIPEGAQSIFGSYIQQGMYFFVAKINPAKVQYAKPGEVVLSPLRFAYDAETFSLPIRLGMINAKEEQDLIVYILGQDQRYEVANYPNTTIPTNIEVSTDVRKGFGTFYTKLFSKTLEANPGAVVTEYSWQATGCDPCPPSAVGSPTLSPDDIATLGGDVILNNKEEEGPVFGGFSQWNVTRLHARYNKDGIKDDLVFKSANSIIGGRQVLNDGILERDVQPSSFNQFQGRYIMRNRWSKGISCDDPVFGVWGGPPEGDEPKLSSALSPNSGGVSVGDDLSATKLATLVREDIDRIKLQTENPIGANAAAGCAVGFGPSSPLIPAALLSVIGGLFFWRRRQR